MFIAKFSGESYNEYEFNINIEDLEDMLTFLGDVPESFKFQDKNNIITLKINKNKEAKENDLIKSKLQENLRERFERRSVYNKQVIKILA